ncbi:MAG: PEP-CTERM sorting domain-containing protein [Phycisphaeraceae bacterium]
MSVRTFLLAIAGAALACGAGTSQGSVILVDFNDAGAAATLGGTWNVIAAPNVGPQALVSSANVTEGVTLSSANWAADSSLSQAPWAADQDWLDADATRDYFFFGGVAGPLQTATVTIAGLVEGGSYVVALAASKETASTSVPRIADYKVNGSFADSTPDGQQFDAYNSGFLGENILTWNSATAGPGGVLTITASTTTTSRSAWLNALYISAVPEPASLALLAAGAVLLRPRRR